jgi:hypothetical protein
MREGRGGEGGGWVFKCKCGFIAYNRSYYISSTADNIISHSQLMAAQQPKITKLFHSGDTLLLSLYNRETEHIP